MLFFFVLFFTVIDAYLVINIQSYREILYEVFSSFDIFQ